MLERVGFNGKFINLIRMMLGTVYYSVLLNDSPWENLGAERGLRQGDPLSLYLFIMVAEVLGRSFSKLVNIGCFKGIKPTTIVDTKVLQ